MSCSPTEITIYITGTQAEIGEIRLNHERSTGKMKGCDVAEITASDRLHLAANVHPDATKASIVIGAITVGLS